MRSFVGIVLLVLLANVSAKDAVRVELPANTEKPEEVAVPVNKTEEKEYTLEELLGEDNVTAIEALLEADKKRHNSTQVLAAALAAAGSKSAEVVNRILGGDLVAVPGTGILVHLANVSAEETTTLEEVAVPVKKTEEKEYTLEELLGEDNVTAINALLEADKKRHNATYVSVAVKPNVAKKKKVKDENRLLGSAAVVDGEYSYNILIDTEFVSGRAVECGGALLSSVWGLTAAQCVAGATAIAVLYNLGAMAVLDTSATGFVHPKFVRNFMLNDIGLVKLDTPVVFGSFSSTIRLSTASVTSMENVRLRIFGNGWSDNDISIPEGIDMQYVDMTNIKKSVCLSQTASFFVAYPTNTGCLSTAAGTKGFCFNENGAPVVHINEDDGSVKLYGVTSQQLGCPSQYPSSFTLVQPYLDWIKMTTNLKTLT